MISVLPITRHGCPAPEDRSPREYSPLRRPSALARHGTAFGLADSAGAAQASAPVRDDGDAAPEGSSGPDRALALLRAARDAAPAERRALHAQVVTEHLGLADALARRFDHRGEDLEDLQQVARAALVDAVRRFEVDRGSFVSFAVPTITGVLKRHFRDRGWLIRPPRRTQELAADVRRLWPELAQQLGAQPSAHQLAVRLGQSVPAVREARHASQWYSANSLDATMAAGAGFASIDNDDLDACEAKIILGRVWQQLTAEERRLLTLRFFEDRSQSEIALQIGTSQMHVSRLLARTLRRLRTSIGEQDDADAPSAESAVRVT